MLDVLRDLAADSSVLLCINSGIANGKVQLAIRPEKPLATMHEQFRIIAAANTFGRGVDRLYVGRNQLDESTMSRFRAGVTPIGYSRELETQLWTARGLKLEDLRTLWKWRDVIEANRLERILCTRFILDAADLLAGGFEWDELTGAFFEGWRDNEVRKVKGE